MKLAADFRRISRECLRGRWLTAVIAGFLATLLGGVASSSPGSSYYDGSSEGSSEYLEHEISQLLQGNAELLKPLLGAGAVLLLVVLAVAAVFLVLGSVVRIGYSRFNLDLVDPGKEPEVGTLFKYFSKWKNLTLAYLREFFVVLLWMLLLIVPGIIASYNYAMTGFILAENPDLSPKEAMRQSKEMMRGNRWRLFCLQFSFIGWGLLASLSLGIGNLWLVPYEQGAFAAFYRDISLPKVQAAPYSPEEPSNPWGQW